MRIGSDVAVTSMTIVERVAHVVIERPAKRNPMDRAVLDGLVEHARSAAELVGSGAIGAVVVAGRGQHLSAGLDLADLAVRWADGPQVLQHLPRLVREAAGASRDGALAAEGRLQLRMLAGGDVSEAVTAAAQDRTPRFGGR